jgi:DNA repair photolyase
MRDNGIQTIAWLSPFLPFINDTEENLRGLLDYCIDSGVYGILCWGIGLTLREGNREYFYSKLDEHFPNLKNVYHKKYGFSYVIHSDNNDALMRIFYETCNKNNIVCDNDELFSYMRISNEKKSTQLSLF